MTTIRRLSVGSHGPAVRKLEQELKERGLLKGPVDNKFDAKTKAAVQKFEHRRGFKEDGVVGGRIARLLDIKLPSTASTAGTTPPSAGNTRGGTFDVVTAKHPWGGTGRALIVGDTEGTVKIVAEKGPDGKAGRILGVHMSGPWVTEQLGAGYFSVNWEATVDDVAHLIQPHPTLSENFGETVLSLTGRGLHS